MVEETIASIDYDSRCRLSGHSGLDCAEQRARASITSANRNPMVASTDFNDHRSPPACRVLDTIDSNYRSSTQAEKPTAEPVCVGLHNYRC